MKEKVQYGTWIRKKQIVIFTLILAVFLGLSSFAFVNRMFLLFLLPALPLAYIVFIISLAHCRLSAAGGDFQDKIHQLMVNQLSSGGRILDIGCGSGKLTIMIAKKFVTSQVMGVDYWGKNWEYSIKQCETNARLEGVKNCTFIKGTASKLDFADNTMDAVVSCMTFHEVRKVDHKEDCIEEALRVLKNGGYFVFLDLFDDRKYYPNFERYMKGNRSWRIDENIRLGELIHLPYPLNDKKALRYARIITGEKIKNN